jgi:hypothetical protein
MPMKRLIVAVLIVAVSGFGVGSACAAEWEPYTQGGQWFPPGAAAHSYYDFCGRWVNNTFAKSETGWGLITFIDTNGGWNHSVQGRGTIRRDLTLAQSRGWVKKPFCRNNSSAWYQGGCFGFIEPTNCA